MEHGIDKQKYLKETSIERICHSFLGLDWQPLITQKDYRILEQCDSVLEMTFLFGAFHYLEQLCDKYGNTAVGEYPIETCKAIHLGEEIEGFCFHGIWPLWYEELGDDAGPLSILIAPQVKFNKNYHHDFAIFYGDDDRTPDNWTIQYGIEIDSKYYHSNRRDKDQYRDSLVDYPVIRLFEEIHKPLDWFKIVIEKDGTEFYRRINDME